MRKISVSILAFFIFALTAHAQTSAITATITDSDSQTWNNGTYTISYVQPAGNSQPPVWNGVPLDDAHRLFKGTLSNVGVLTVSLPDNTFITPPGSSWLFVLCSYSSAPCSQIQTPVAGSSLDLSSLLSAGVKAPRFPAVPGAYGYLDVEVFPIPVPGGQYFNVTNLLQRVWNGSAWQNGGGGGGGGGSVGPGSINSVACFTATTTVQNCPDNITDIGGVVTIPTTTQIGAGTGPAAITLPSGAPASCPTPTAGLNDLCSDSTNNTINESLNGGAYIPLGSLANGTVGQPAAYNGTNSAVSVPLSVVVDAVQGAGIGATPTAWVTGTTYPLCQSVSNSGQNYLAVSANNGATTPGTNRTIWYPVPNGTRPTQFDCAFYIAQSRVVSTAGVDLQLGSGVYISGIGMTYPTVSSPGFPGVNIHGAGVSVTTIRQGSCLLVSCGGDGLAMLNVPPASVAFQLPRLQFYDFTLDANALAWNFDLHACQQCTIENVDLINTAPGSDHAFEAGTIGGNSSGWVFELNLHNSSIVYNGAVTGHPHGNGAATFTVAVTAGVPAITVTNGGLNYDTAQMTFRLVKAGGLEACTSIGTFTATVNGSGTITSVTTTSTGCAATGLTFLQIYPGLQVSYGYKFSDMTDSDTISNLSPGVGAICGVYTANVNNFNTYYKLHPQGTFNGVCINGTENYIGTQIDSVYNHGFDIENSFNQVNLYGSGFEWNNSHYDGSGDYFFGTIANPPTSSPAGINIYGDTCGNTPQQNGYAHITTSAGTVDNGNAFLPPRLNVYATTYCSQFASATQPNFSNMSTDILWGGGKFTNYWDWNVGGGGNTTLGLTSSAGNPFALQLTNINPATSGANFSSPQYQLLANYWDGSVSQPYGPRFRATCAAGTGPLCTFFFDHAGIEPAGGHVYNIDASVIFQQHINQSATGRFAGSCTMSAATTCTFSINTAFTGTPLCVVSPDATATLSATAIEAQCSVSSTTVTVTAGASNSRKWDAVLIGNPN